MKVRNERRYEGFLIVKKEARKKKVTYAIGLECSTSILIHNNNDDNNIYFHVTFSNRNIYIESNVLR